MSADDVGRIAAAGVRELAEALRPYHLRYERARDARAVFAYAYYRMTQDLAEVLETASPVFDDPQWIATLARAFADRFIAAMNALDTWLDANPRAKPSPQVLYPVVPPPWADVYLAIREGQSYVLEDLVFSMMAHISYDLPHALLQAEFNPDRLADYHRMNDALAKNIDRMQDVVARRYQRLLSSLDRLGGAFDEFLTNYGIRGARAVAFYNALRLSRPSSKAAAEASVERSTRLFIRTIREPDEWWLRAPIRVIRILLPPRRRWPKAS